MLIKKKVFYNIIARNNEDNIEECINSILNQKDIIPYISVSALVSSDKTFYRAKRFCKDNVRVCDVNYVVNDRMAVFRTTVEKNSIMNGLLFAKDKQCQYACFMQTPGILNAEYTKKCISLIKDEVIGAYSDIIDTGVKLYSNLPNSQEINLSPFFVIKKTMADMYNHEFMGDYLRYIINLGVFKHIPKFLVESKWIESTLKLEKALSKAV